MNSGATATDYVCGYCGGEGHTLTTSGQEVRCRPCWGTGFSGAEPSAREPERSGRPVSPERAQRARAAGGNRPEGEKTEGVDT